MPTGYCTVEDVRRALRERELQVASQDEQIAIDAICGQTEWLEKSTKRHWYEPTRPGEDEHEILPTGPKSRDDEEDIPTGGAAVLDGTPPAPKTWQGSYTRIDLDRRDAESIDELLVRGGDGYTDWVASPDHDGGTWPDALGQDYVLRVNNGGWSALYLDTDNWLVEGEDDEYVLDSWSNAVYVTFTYGNEGISSTVRRAVALRAGAELIFDEEADISIAGSGQLVNIETEAQSMQDRADELLEVHL